MLQSSASHQKVFLALIISQCIPTSNYYAVHLKRILFVNYLNLKSKWKIKMSEDPLTNLCSIE